MEDPPSDRCSCEQRPTSLTPTSRLVVVLLGAAIVAALTPGCSRPLTRPHSPASLEERHGGAESTPRRIRLLTETRYTASLVHWIDSLAGTSGGKTIPIYQHLWQQRFGPPGEDDRHALSGFAAMRQSIDAQTSCGSPPEGAAEAVAGWRLHFLYLALEASSTEELLDRVRPCLTAGEAGELEAALTRFTPGFDEFWRNGTYLQEFETRYRNYVEHGEMLDYLDEVARFFDVDPSTAPPATLCFVLLPFDGPTHAQALGSRLLIEVRPSDTPADQTQVVAHEMSHYLFEQMPSSRRAALEARARSAGPSGAKAWGLLQESLPTALGQGLAVARLTPRDFDLRASWYHIPLIDRFAKMIYPILRRHMEAGRTIEGPFLEEVVRAYEDAPSR